MNIWGLLLKAFGWKVQITAPRRQKCVICVAPHTSNYDFLLGLAAYESRGWKANFLMKDFWFFFPLKYVLRAFGGIPVPRKKGNTNLTKSVAELFKTRDYVNLAVTPEGTRSRREQWRTGFLYIAYDAEVPIQLGVIDYTRKLILIEKEFTPSGNIDEDMAFVKNYYRQHDDAARYPEKFAL